VPGKIRERGKGLDMEIKIPGFGTGVKGKDLAIFTRQFSTMIDAGLPLVQCLHILSTESTNPALRKVLADVKEAVESGATFADGLAKHPEVFDELYVNLVAAGEVGGILETILNRLAEYIEKAEKLKSQIKGAMVYPIIVLTIACGIVAILLLKVIPVFGKMFKDLGKDLPGFTLWVMGLSDWFRHNFLYMVIGIVVFIVAYKAVGRNPKGRKMLDSFFLKLPLFGDLIKKTAVARFTRTLGTMVSSGVPILDALEITAKTAGNKIVEEDIMRVRQAVSEGKMLVEPLAQSKVFPAMVTQMIGVGEQTGAMDAMLQKIADFYEQEVDAAVAALTSAMEPLLILFLGVVVGGIAIAMYLPLFSIVNL
jgi:type IV pilus assembly protein PilC